MEAADGGPDGQYRRRDFERNREAILDAANECFMEDGAKASISSVAERAGVGAATVYRHFPTRGDLERAVLEVRITAYAEAIDAAQADPDGRAAFRATIHEIVRLQSRDRAFRELMSGDTERFMASATVQRFATSLMAALARADSEGVTRAEVSGEDIMLLLIATEGVARKLPEDSEPALSRIVDLILDGVCGDRTALSGAALDAAQLLAAARD